MIRIASDIIAASHTRSRKKPGDGARQPSAPVSHPAPREDDGTVGQNNSSLTSTTAEFQADGAP